MNTQIQVIVTPKKFILNGIYFGPSHAENVYIMVHGLGSNLFRYKELIEKLVTKKDAVLAFNNRGSGTVNRIKQIDKKETKGHKSHFIGMAHEVFTDCVDDIEGAINCAKEQGAKNIYLLGHSTGCQKSVYYLSKKRKAPIKGAILLAPMSDFADAYAFMDKKIYNKALAHAKKMVASDRAHELMPKNIWPIMLDAQRFLSLYTPESTEEIFSYASGKNPKILKSVSQRLLLVLASEDEYRDRPIEQIAEWFENNCPAGKGEVRIIQNSLHSFEGHVDDLVRLIKDWRFKNK